MNFFAEITVFVVLPVLLFMGVMAFCIDRSSSSPFAYTVEVIDGCEYLRFDTYSSFKDAITHKGNCKNH